LRIFERYFISLTLTYAFTTVILSAYGENRLDLYVCLYILEYFTLTLLHSPFNPKAQKIMDVTGFALFAIFVFIVAVKVVEILYGASLI
jgi:hypothetical protein